MQDFCEADPESTTLDVSVGGEVGSLGPVSLP